MSDHSCEKVESIDPLFPAGPTIRSLAPIDIIDEGPPEAVALLEIISEDQRP